MRTSSEHLNLIFILNFIFNDLFIYLLISFQEKQKKKKERRKKID